VTFVGLLAALTAIYVAAKLLGEVAERIGQPAVLGELVAGVVLGGSVLALVDPGEHTIHMLAELGVVILLFEIGLDSDLGELIRVGPQSLAVAIAGMVLPFVLGYGVAAALGTPTVTSVFVGATLTATSIGITARVLSDLGKIGTSEAKIIIGAAVVDDILGLVVLALVKGLAGEGAVSTGTAIRVAALAIGFFAAAIVIGRLTAPALVRIASAMKVRGVLIVSALSFAFVLAIVADAVGSATIVGAFAAGLALAATDRKVDIEERVRPVSDLFVPIFFASVGAAVDVRYFNPFDEERRPTLAVAGLLFVAALLGKWAAGFFARRKRERLNRNAIGVGMIPRGEVGLVFAGIGLSTGVVGPDLYAAVVVVVILTTFVAPPLLRLTLR
jgi:Kef-type K+ transport system membrane component KefB